MIAAAWVGVALAAPWYVPDEGLAADVQAAATELGREAEVVVGPRPEGAPGVAWDGSVLDVRLDGVQRSGEVDDPCVALWLVRAWSLPVAPPAGRPAAAPSEAWEPTASQTRWPGVDRSRTPWSFEVGAGTRSVVGAPGAVQAARSGARATVGPWLVVGEVAVGVATEARARSEGVFADAGVVEDPWLDRWSVAAGAGARSPGAWSVEGWLGPELRSVDHRLIEASDTLAWTRVTAAGLRSAIGLGRALGPGRATVSAWGRSALGTPPSAGIDLDLALVVRRRRG